MVENGVGWLPAVTRMLQLFVRIVRGGAICVCVPPGSFYFSIFFFSLFSFFRVFFLFN